MDAQVSGRNPAFLSDVTIIPADMTQGVLGTMRFDPDAYAPQLFDHHDISRPAMMDRAVPKRCAEFLAARVLAGALMRRVGVPAAQVGVGSDRGPVWPRGMTGSISHTDGIAACAVTTDHTRLVGVDIETVIPASTQDSILSYCCTKQDAAIVRDGGGLSELMMATLVFSAKETVFKAVSRLVRRLLDFDSSTLVAPPDNGRVWLELTRNLHPLLPAGRRFDVRFKVLPGHMLTWVDAPHTPR